jgi:hypothetical protein
LKQQYFFASATLADIFRRYACLAQLSPHIASLARSFNIDVCLLSFKIRPRSMLDLPTKVAIQLNDTHPTIAVAELMRKLLDEENLSWDQVRCAFPSLSRLQVGLSCVTNGCFAVVDHHHAGFRVHEPHGAARGSGALALARF